MPQNKMTVARLHHARERFRVVRPKQHTAMLAKFGSLEPIPSDVTVYRSKADAEAGYGEPAVPQKGHTAWARLRAGIAKCFSTGDAWFAAGATQG